MVVPLLHTKFYIPPVRERFVSRPRLIKRLNESLGSGRKLILISAPAGYGKTTLLNAWIGQIKQPVSWLSLEPTDNDVNRFWRYIITALQKVDITIGETALTALQSQQPPLDRLVTALINDIVTLSYPLILVVDDYHVIELEAIHNSFKLLIDRAPPHLRITIATRIDPPFSLSLYRARSELTEIRAADLFFTIEEVTEFFNTTMGLDLPLQDIVLLAERTEGWIVGLQMTALSLQGKATSGKHNFVAAFASDDRYVADFLTDEVLQCQPSHVLDFLMKTSFLERLCGSLCDAVTNRNDSQEILRYLEHANLFTISMDNKRQWYRYHHLFAGLLHQRLYQYVKTSDLTALYLRASQWYEHAGFIDEAITCALDAPDLTFAVTLLEKHILTFFYRSELNLVHRWLKSLPEDLFYSHPLLCAVYAATIWHSPPFPPESTKQAEYWLQKAEDALSIQSIKNNALVTYTQDDDNVTVCFTAMFRAFMARFRGDDPHKIIRLTQSALDLLPEEDQALDNQNYLRFHSALTFNLGMAYDHLGDYKKSNNAFALTRQIAAKCGDYFNTCAAAYMQIEMLRSRGQLQQAAAMCQEALDAICESVDTNRSIPFTGALYIAQGRILLEWNDLVAAERVLNRGMELIKLTPMVNIQSIGCFALARLQQAQNDVEGALTWIESAEQLWSENSAQAAARRVRLWLTLSREEPTYLITATQWSKERHINLENGKVYSEEKMTLARLLITQHRVQPFSKQPDLQPLLDFLNKQLTVALHNTHTFWSVEILVLQALAHQTLGNLPLALSALRQALTLAEEEEFIRLFVDEGQHMKALMGKISTSDCAPSYIKKLISAFEPLIDKRLKAGSSNSVIKPLLNQLTPREREVLQLISTGISNREIAENLFIAVNTLKKHITSIYSKLGVDNRLSAVIRARELDLLE